jgi:hypothetical protein
VSLFRDARLHEVKAPLAQVRGLLPARKVQNRSAEGSVVSKAGQAASTSKPTHKRLAV